MANVIGAGSITPTTINFANGSQIGDIQNINDFIEGASKGLPKTFNPIKDKKTLHGGKKVSGTVRQADGTTKPFSKSVAW